MFGNKTDDVEKLVKGCKWEKIEKKYVRADDASRLAAAKALADSKADEGYNLLIDLLKDTNPDVQLAAIKSLGACASDRAVTQLQWVITKTPETDKERLEAIQTAIDSIRDRKR